jgi:hypothetical protein
VPIAHLSRCRQQGLQLLAFHGDEPERFVTVELFALQTIS